MHKQAGWVRATRTITLNQLHRASGVSDFPAWSPDEFAEDRWHSSVMQLRVSAQTQISPASLGLEMRRWYWVGGALIGDLGIRTGGS